MPEAIITADWNRLIVPRVAPEDLSLADQYLHETIAAYGSPERYYHTLMHIVDCHQKLEPYENREDEIIFNDIDMSILAEPRDTYSAYSLGVRREFGWVDDEHYRRGRIAALTGFARPIFKHPDFVHLNPIAEENIESEIQELSVA